jgi:hypothetical protein
MKSLRFILLTVMMASSTKIAFCQENQPNFYANTVDGLNWKGTYFMCSVSPLSSFFSLSPQGDYKSLYKDLFTLIYTHSSLPQIEDKNYVASWTVINRHLYLYDIMPHISIDTVQNIDLGRIEKFLFMKFSKDNLSRSDRRRYKNGVIPATWFTDTLYIKRFPDKGEKTDSFEYNNAAFIRLVFEKGILTEEKKVTDMNELK